MSDKKEIKEIDVASLDSELAAARTLEEGKGDKFIMMASVVAFLMTSFHIYTASRACSTTPCSAACIWASPSR